MKKKGVMIMGQAELNAFREIFNNEKVGVLLSSLESLTPARKGAKGEEGDVLQI
jgi:hypothetical protein